MTNGSMYWWLENKGAPFATLLRVIFASCHPEADPEAYDDLIGAARDPDEEMHRFKEELRAAITDPAQVPAEALFEAAHYYEDSDEAFLRRVWHDLYGDEPVTASAH